MSMLEGGGRSGGPGRMAGLTADGLSVSARCVVGGLFVAMGLSKALDPVDFLKLVRQYELIEASVGLNLIAVVLPWFELFCGVLLLAGVAVRGTAVVSLGMLMPFSLVVWDRARGLHESLGGPFCGIRFDCGCGAGEVAICHKLAENAVLMLCSAWLLGAGGRRWCLWPALFRGRG
ncbi:MAG: DoxX family membrane protein [Verrucomicrobiae bacterium]|nr:DoxX family membrane protein [Verrucomicrobiae bacterium]